MKKQKMERLDGPLFQPLTEAEGSSLVGGTDVVTNYISFIPTGGGADILRDAG